MDTAGGAESFRDRLLRHRGRSGLTQRQFAERVGVHWRSVQGWEIGASLPDAEHLEAIIRTLLDHNGLSERAEMAEAEALWAAVRNEAPRLRTAFDGAWFERLLADRELAGEQPTASESVATSQAIGAQSQVIGAERRQDLGDAPDVLDFVGRATELQTLYQWVVEERVPAVALVGMGGVGKTRLAAKLTREVAPAFERVYWRSLRDAPPSHDWLAGAIGFLSDQLLVPPPNESERLIVLLDVLRSRRCLVVLDNFETLFEPAQRDQRYREGLAGYGRILRALGEAAHQSCLLLTSRETPSELMLASDAAVRTLELGGLSVEDAREVLAFKRLEGSSEEWDELVARFAGNGLALKVIGETIRDLFDGQIGAFVDAAAPSTDFGSIRRLLSDQVDRSSGPEQQILRVLAIEREPVSLAGLLDALGTRIGRGTLLDAIEALGRRSLLDRAETPGAAAFTLQSLVLEYVTDRLGEAVADEIERGKPELLVEQPLIKAQAKEYVRQTQDRLIGAPILLHLHHSEKETEKRLLALLDAWRGRPSEEQGYGPGNVVNLLRLLRGGRLRGVNLSRLVIRQAYLAEVEAQEASLAGARLDGAVLADAVSLLTSVALSADGTLLAAATSTGDVWLWRVADRTPLLAAQGHTGEAWGVALSADGHLLASGGTDGTLRLWETESGQPLATFRGHTGGVRGMALSADGRLLASGGTDATVLLWETSTGRILATFQGHTGEVWCMALSADGRLLASGGTDGTMRLWDTSTGSPVAILQGHIGTVWGVALSADGRLLASGGTDGTLRLWETESGQPLATLRGHTGRVFNVALSFEGQLVASAGEDGTVRLWDTSTASPVAILQGHTGTVYSAPLSSDGQLVASGGVDGTVRLWETSTGRPLATLRGHTGAVYSVALSSNGQLVASGGTDGTVRAWETEGRSRATLQGHTGAVRGMAASSDGQLIASGGVDGTVRLWETSTGRSLATLREHTGAVYTVALSADAHLLASGGTDGTLRLWETSTGRALAALRGHTGAIRSIALGADSELLASGGTDSTVRLWDASTGRAVASLHGHTGEVWCVALSADGRLLASGGANGAVWLWDTGSERPVATLQGHAGAVSGVALAADGQLLASCSTDGTVRLWDTRSARLLLTLRGHTGGITGVALSVDRHMLVSGGYDGTVKLWDTDSGVCVRTLRPERRYELLDITGLEGITDAQRAALLALGAVDRREG